MGHFCPLGSGSGSTDPIESGSGSATLDEGSFVVLAVSPEERSELELEEPHTELAHRYVDSHLGSEKGCNTEKIQGNDPAEFILKSAVSLRII